MTTIRITIESTDEPSSIMPSVRDFLDYVLLLSKSEFGDVERFEAVITDEGSTLWNGRVDVGDAQTLDDFRAIVYRFAEEAEVELQEFTEFDPALFRR